MAPPPTKRETGSAFFVIPAKAGISWRLAAARSLAEIPAFAGMTVFAAGMTV
jgi:hypothetical protein